MRICEADERKDDISYLLLDILFLFVEFLFLRPVNVVDEPGKFAALFIESRHNRKRFPIAPAFLLEPCIDPLLVNIHARMITRL